MNAERRVPEGNAAITEAGGPVTTVRHLPDRAPLRLGCPAGCGPVHECGVGEPVPDPPCSRRCQTLGVVEQRRVGELYGGCLCTEVA